MHLIPEDIIADVKSPLIYCNIALDANSFLISVNDLHFARMANISSSRSCIFQLIIRPCNHDIPRDSRLSNEKYLSAVSYVTRVTSSRRISSRYRACSYPFMECRNRDLDATFSMCGTIKFWSLSAADRVGNLGRLPVTKQTSLLG